MSHSAKYTSISLKVNMKKIIIKKEDLLRKKADLVRRKLTTLARSFDKIEKVLRMSKMTMCDEYSLICGAHKEFCAKLARTIDVLNKNNKIYNEHLARNDPDTQEISVGVEDLINKVEDGIIELPRPGSPVINFVSNM